MTARPFEHPVRYGARLGVRDGEVPCAEILAVCAPCSWRRVLTNGAGRDHIDAMTWTHSGYRQCSEQTCRAWIIDARTENGSQTVVDAQESADGNLALSVDPDRAGGYRVRYLKADAADLADGEVQVMTHFKTCTAPEKFRRRR